MHYSLKYIYKASKNYDFNKLDDHKKQDYIHLYHNSYTFTTLNNTHKSSYRNQQIKKIIRKNTPKTFEPTIKRLAVWHICLPICSARYIYQSSSVCARHPTFYLHSFSSKRQLKESEIQFNARCRIFSFNSRPRQRPLGKLVSNHGSFIL